MSGMVQAAENLDNVQRQTFVVSTRERLMQANANLASLAERQKAFYARVEGNALEDTQCEPKVDVDGVRGIDQEITCLMDHIGHLENFINAVEELV